MQKLYLSKKLTCESPMEIPYYGVFNEEPLCFHCGSQSNLIDLYGNEKQS